MKKTLYMLLAAATLAACSLEEDPHDQIPESEVYTSQDAIFRNTLASLYNNIGGSADGQGLQGTCRGVYDLQTFGSDEALIPTRGVDWYDGGLWQDMYKHSWDVYNQIVKNSWLYLYKMVNQCNHSLEILDRYQDLADNKYVEWNAELRALRAMYYWYLIDLFGDVPLVTTTDISMNSVTRESRSKVFQFIESELCHVYEDLPNQISTRPGEYYGRITQDVALFILAKLMLNAEVYTGTPRWKDCVLYCDMLDMMRYVLNVDYPENFAVHNENSPENIFVIPMDKDLITTQQWNMHRSYHYRQGAAFNAGGENGTCATLNTLRIYGYNTSEQDNRFIYNFFSGYLYDNEGREILDRTGNPLYYYPEAVALDLSNSPYRETAGARMHKYEVDIHSYKDGLLVDNDIVLFRFADVLLMRAEAKLRLGEDGHEDFDAVRKRVFMEPRPYTLDNIYDERLLEFCWEGWRRQDMIRFDRYKSLYTGPDAVDESDGHTKLFPIPADVRTLNPNLTQNTGY